MTVRRAAVYFGVASLLAAWFSSAASLPNRQDEAHPAPAATPQEEPSLEEIAAEVRTRAQGLKDRTGAATLPERPVRNPFAFRGLETPAPAPSLRRLEAAVFGPPAPAVVEPPLALIGVAEESRAQGPVRTAMFAAGADELIVAGVGDVVLGRYRVVRVSLDGVDLADVATGALRTLPLSDR